jgi:hypothetical protein
LNPGVLRPLAGHPNPGNRKSQSIFDLTRIDWIGFGENKETVETTQQRLKRIDGMKETHQ